MDTWNRRDWGILLALTALAAGLRFYKLGVVPPGFQFDEAYNAIDAALVLNGHRPLFLPANAGREVLYTYWQAALAAVFGLNLYSLRLASALGGIVAIPVSYVVLRRMLRRRPRAVAGFTAAVLSISLWHLHFSHYGIRVILQPVIFSGVFAFFWLGTRDERIWPYVASGVLAGLSVWNHPTGRLVPFVLIGYTGWVLWQHREARRLRLNSPLGGLILTGVVAFTVFLPLGIEFYRHPEFFFGHASEVSVFAERVGGNSPLAKMGENALRVLGMFTFQGDREWIHNLPGRPVFDPLLAIPFVLGVVIWALRLRRRDDPDRDALMMLAVWSLVMLFPSILSDDAPNFSRTMPALPALFVAAGLGLTRIYDLCLTNDEVSIPIGRFATVALLLTSGTLAGYDYFVRFPRAAGAYYAYDVDKLDAWSYLQEQAGEHQVYFSQLWADHATIDFLRRQARTPSIKSLDTDDTIVLPPIGESVLYAFPPEQDGRAERVAAAWPSVVVETVYDPHDVPLLLTVTVDSEMLQAWPPALQPEQTHNAQFEDGPTLVGMRSDGPNVRLYWHAGPQTLRSLTTFVQLLNDRGRMVGQLDKLPGNGSYPTYVWSPGERIIERYRPEVDPCAGGEPVRVQTGWYELSAGGERLPRADAPGTTGFAGEYTLPFTSYPQDRVQPETIREDAVTEHLTLLGYTLHAEGLEAGSPLTLDLYWRGERTAGNESVQIDLIGQGRNATLWDGAVLPTDDVQWRDGEIFCRRGRMRFPLDTPAGSYSLALDVAGTTVPLTDLHVGESTRRFDVPAVDERVDATLGERVRLVGYTMEAGRPLSVTLVWKALRPPEQSYKVFVHLLNEGGEIVAQSDAVPAGGYATTEWLADEVVLDTHTIEVPTGVPAGTYRLVAGMYDPVSGERMPAKDTDGEAVLNGAIPLGDVEVQ